MSTQADSPLPSTSSGDLSDLRRQLRETADDNKTLLVELVEMRREMNELLQESLREQQTQLDQIKATHTSSIDSKDTHTLMFSELSPLPACVTVLW